MNLTPKVVLVSRGAVKSLFPNWDPSIEEVVFYLAKQYGEEKVMNVVATIKTQLKGEQLARAKTIEYWLGKHA